jgi:hypothetical protein
MPTVKCWGCRREFDETHMKWFKPFAGGVERTDNPQVMRLIPALFDSPEPGAMPYCPDCLQTMKRGGEE